MKVVLNKDHAVLGKKGAEIEVPEARAEYLKRVGAIEHGEPVDAEVKKPAEPKKSSTEKEVKVVEPAKKTTKKK